jgi:hypothetical protein
LLRAFEHLYWEDSTEASQLCTQCRDSVLPDAQNFLKNKAKILYHAVSDEKTRCMISTSENCLSWEYLMRVLHQLSSQSCWRLSELSVA